MSIVISGDIRISLKPKDETLLENFADNFGECKVDLATKEINLNFQMVVILSDAEVEALYIRLPISEDFIKISSAKIASPYMGQKYPHIPWSGKSRFVVNKKLKLEGPINHDLFLEIFAKAGERLIKVGSVNSSESTIASIGRNILRQIETFIANNDLEILSANTKPLIEHIENLIQLHKQDINLSDILCWVLNNSQNPLIKYAIDLIYSKKLLQSGNEREFSDKILSLYSKRPTDLYLQSIFYQEVNKIDLGKYQEYLHNSFCFAPFTRIEILPNGNCFVCCPHYLSISLGNIFKENLEEVYNSERAKLIRKSIVEGNFQYCSIMTCPFISSFTLPSKGIPKVEEIYHKFSKGENFYPEYVSLCLDNSCNLYCKSCRTKRYIADRKRTEELYETFLKNIKPFLIHSKIILITGTGDPIASPFYRRVIKTIVTDPELKHLKLELFTNANLLSPKVYDLLQLSNRVQGIKVSIDAATKETYEKLRRGGRFDILLKNIDFISKLRINQEIKSLHFLFVVQKENYKEMPMFIDLAREFCADNVFFTKIRNWGTYTDEEFKDIYIFDPKHPEHEKFLETLLDPRLESKIVNLGDLQPYVDKAKKLRQN